MSPFKSEKQKKYLWANKPEVARRWTKKYGGKIQGGGGHSPIKFKKREGTA